MILSPTSAPADSSHLNKCYYHPLSYSKFKKSSSLPLSTQISHLVYISLTLMYIFYT